MDHDGKRGRKEERKKRKRAVGRVGVSKAFQRSFQIMVRSSGGFSVSFHTVVLFSLLKAAVTSNLISFMLIESGIVCLIGRG